MLAMLPGIVVSVGSLVGLRPGTGPLGALSSIPLPITVALLALGVGLTVAGNLRCSWWPAATAGVGGLLLLASMYVFTTGTASMDNMATTSPASTTNEPMFYAGLALFVIAYLAPIVHRRQGWCRPVFARPRPA